ncbi:unnamed protein product, partial [Ectocarpus sp. 4 AP-2014]
ATTQQALPADLRRPGRRRNEEHEQEGRDDVDGHLRHRFGVHQECCPQGHDTDPRSLRRGRDVGVDGARLLQRAGQALYERGRDEGRLHQRRKRRRGPRSVHGANRRLPGPWK